MPSGRRRRRLQETQRGEVSAEERPDELNQRLAFTGLDLDLHHSKLQEGLQMPMRLQEVLAGRGGGAGRRLAHTSPHTSPPAAGPAAVWPPKTHQNHQNRSEAPAAATTLPSARVTSLTTPTKTAPRMFRGAVVLPPSGGRTHLGVLLGLGVGNGDDTDTG